MKALNFIMKNAVIITMVIVAALFIFSKVEDGRKIGELNTSITESKARAELLEKQSLSHATKIQELNAVISQKDSLISDLDDKIDELYIIGEIEHNNADDLNPDQYQGEIDKYYKPSNGTIVAQLDSSQAIGVIHATIENIVLKKKVELIQIQRIELGETIVVRDNVISMQTTQISLLNQSIVEHKKIHDIDQEKYKVMFKKYRRQKWLVRGIAVAGIAAIILKK